MIVTRICPKVPSSRITNYTALRIPDQLSQPHSFYDREPAAGIWFVEKQQEIDKRVSLKAVCIGW